MINRNMILVTLATFFICATSFAAVERQELIPPGYAVTVRVSDTSKFIEQFKKSSLSKLWCDPQMKEVFGKKGFVESIKNQMGKGKDGEELAHLEWQEMMMLKGEMVMAFRSEFSEEPLIIAYMEEEDYMRSLDMDKRISELKKNGVLTIKKGTFQGVPFIQLITEETVHGKKIEKISWQAHVASTFVASESKEFVEKTVVAIRKRGIKEPKGVPVMNVKLSVDTLIDQMEKAMPPPPPPRPGAGPSSFMPPPPRPKQIFSALGFDPVDSIAIDITLKDKEMLIESHVLGNDLTKGLFKIADIRPSSLDLVVPFIPSDAYSYEVSRVDLRALWLEIPKMVTIVDPMYGASFQMMMAQMMGMLGLDIDAELLAHLDTQYLSFSTSAEKQPVGVTCIRLNNEEAVKAALGKMFSDTGVIRKGAAASMKIEEFRGSPMYIFPPQQPRNAFMTPPPPAPVQPLAEGLSTAITVGGGYLMYGGEPGIRMVLRSLDASEDKKTSFYSSKLVKEMRRLAPKNCLGYGMIDWSRFITTFLSESGGTTPFDALKMMAGSKGVIPGANPNDIFGNADYSKLPSAEHMSKFFGPSFSYSTKDSGGFHGKLIMRYRPLGQK